MTDPKIKIFTAAGDIQITLFASAAPQTVGVFLKYLRAGLYNDTAFFRIVSHTHPQTGAAAKIEVIQGGPEFDRSGHNPALQRFQMPHEPTGATGLSHRHGTLGMGRFAPGESYGGFYICVGDQPELDEGGARFPDGWGGAAFGQVTGGLDVIDAIFAHAGRTEFTDRPVTIMRIEEL